MDEKKTEDKKIDEPIYHPDEHEHSGLLSEE